MLGLSVGLLLEPLSEFPPLLGLSVGLSAITGGFGLGFTVCPPEDVTLSPSTLSTLTVVPSSVFATTVSPFDFFSSTSFSTSSPLATTLPSLSVATSSPLSFSVNIISASLSLASSTSPLLANELFEFLYAITPTTPVAINPTDIAPTIN